MIAGNTDYKLWCHSQYALEVRPFGVSVLIHFPPVHDGNGIQWRCGWCFKEGFSLEKLTKERAVSEYS